ncbi:MAG: nucleotidyl transferase AbiEii/AbiGii toxin family protein [Bacteroidales bacterium]|jgi:predicted nucleotidyltransferase component of viral defense system|nr:nucleotidyl transferase AbiEii/AbiGii toxin family protein [Bacteroidales bacterium]
MIDINKHKYFMMQILHDIYSDLELANALGFKGGTAAMFFYNLPRFSVDLDFNLLKPELENNVYKKLHNILLKYGKIDDEAQKFFGHILVLDYGKGERKLKVEVSNRQYDNHYQVKTAMGTNMLVLTLPDMLAHKLCALLDRNQLTNRDIFDCWFFLSNRTPVNGSIVESRMNIPFADYLQKCADTLEKIEDKGLLNGLGELLDTKTKNFVRHKLRKEIVFLLRVYKEFPVV